MTEAGLIERARIELVEARNLLVEATPEHLDACHGPLERAAGFLANGLDELRREPARGHEAAAVAIHRLRRELAQVRALNEQAAGLSLGWMRVLGGMAGADYSPRGERDWLALVAPGRQVSIAG